jgi:hypothetical protein
MQRLSHTEHQPEQIQQAYELALGAAADVYVLTADAVNMTGLAVAVGIFGAVLVNTIDRRYANLPYGYLAISKDGLRETAYGLTG